MKRHYVAVDLGATSGRVILGTVVADKISMEEINRFPNKIVRTSGHYYWDLLALYGEIIKGLQEVARRNINPVSIGVDTWGVDLAMFDHNGQLLGNPLSYRDPHTEGEPERFFENIPKSKVYEKTGIQVMNFNTLFQLSAMKREGSVALNVADKLLFLPDAIGFLLTGKAVTEYTIASTSSFLNPVTRRLDSELLQEVGLSEDRFGRLVTPGTVLGPLTKEVQQITGLGEVNVVSVAGHDTASAVAAVPAMETDFAFLSSGTWSLMGVEERHPIINEASASENYTNEGGVEGTTRFLKNICGMWLLERCREEWKKQGLETSYPRLNEMMKEAQPFRSLVFPDASAFAMPDNMPAAIADYCKETSQPIPETQGQYVRCIFDSLTLRYREVFGQLQHLTGRVLKVLHIIGGGSQNALLCQMTANTVEVPVIAGPVEGTALGNIMLQAKADGLVQSLAEMREVISKNIDTRTYQPLPVDGIEAAYQRFLNLSR